jgi:hypothetical protein
LAYLKLDLKVNNPKKLYRQIYDICEDEISSRGYYISHTASFKPLLKENALHNTADFHGRIAISREIFSLNLISLIVGLAVITAGIILLSYPNIYTPIPSQLLGVIAIIAGIIVIFLKSKSYLAMDIDIEGESYRTKSITKNNFQNAEPNSFEELGVVSDVRLTVKGWLREEKALTGNPTENMKRDLKTLTEKITAVVESYVIKN